ncbi:Smg protein [Ectothiorhodosinus mongolicus]|uniref:Protein Smg homolog n=1 Tax=Ectothiorhodosinus mongolicus TaxID=233100 RepID=A0A1R3VXM2_9GAMM|nr:DUF494 domain-containing protein [Ectothiorhodosinus mongolicus]ULX57066.1 DUF494 domain-containing protein [Ectothiorhodosinus mongolicus]SIT69742.1 Smg protein [Ectothiorhodosinus mongolicus]
MKENVLDVLMYLFEHYIDDNIEFEPDREQLQDALLDAGFPGEEISKAFAWLESLTSEDHAPGTLNTASSLRIYSTQEMRRLDADSRGFLLFLEQNGVLESAMRERVITRIMELEADNVSLDETKWITLMVMFNEPGQEAACSWLENMIFEHPPEYLH